MARRRAALAWKPQFFRILLPGFRRRLSIPRPFNRYISRKGCTSARILSPRGNRWQVQVHGDHENHLYFGEGWEVFCQAHDLNVGCFLVFTYEGEMVFSVTVFDPSSCVRKYSPERQEPGRATEANEGSGYLDKERMAECSEPESDNHEEQDAGTVDPAPQVPRTGGSFVIKIKTLGYLKPSLHIPKAFHEGSGISCVDEVILRDPMMRLWPTTIYHPCSGSKSQSRLGYGWRKFCTNNRVEEGDVCVFQILPEEKFTIHVSIHKKRCGATDE